MEIFIGILKWVMINVAVLITSITVNAAAPVQDPGVSIITDKIPGLPVTHGLTKLTAALLASWRHLILISSLRKPSPVFGWSVLLHRKSSAVLKR
jgi:hypothetical protein